MKKKTIAKVLKSWRLKNDFSQQKAAFILNCSIAAIQSWEQERSEPMPPTADFIREKCKETHNDVGSGGLLGIAISDIQKQYEIPTL
jgi:transcriptional regulator with XRE-family HTH domain